MKMVLQNEINFMSNFDLLLNIMARNIYKITERNLYNNRIIAYGAIDGIVC